MNDDRKMESKHWFHTEEQMRFWTTGSEAVKEEIYAALAEEIVNFLV